MWTEKQTTRFLSRVDTSGGVDACWPWQGGLDDDGYGKFRRDSSHLRAHRAMLELVGRDMPDGLVTDHLCRNRRCVNPRHLEMVTVDTNNVRAVNRAADGKRARLEGLCVRGHVLAEVGEYVSFNKARGYERRTCKQCQKINVDAYNLRRRRRALAGRDYLGAEAEAVSA